jgi:iron complex outermembrane receptor protein
MLNQVDVIDSVLRKQPVSVMERKFDTISLEKIRTSNVSQLLMTHSPVFIKTYGPGGLSTASFRGTTAGHTLVLWNDFRLNAPNLGQVDFSLIPVFFSENIGLSWGGKTARQSGGFGGVVALDNKSVFNKGFSTELMQTIGSFRSLGTFATFSYSNRKIHLRTKFFQNSSRNDFEFLNTAVIPKTYMKQPNADYFNFGFMQEVHWLTKYGMLTATSWNQWNDKKLPPIMTNMKKGGKTEEYADEKFSRNYLSFKPIWQKGSLLLKSAYFAERQHYFLRTTSAVSDETVSLVDATNNADIFNEIVQVEQQIFKSWCFLAKVQWDFEKVYSNNYRETKQRNTISFFVETKFSLFRDVHFVTSVRNDIVDGKTQGYFPSANLTYTPVFLKGFSLTLSGIKNYRPPSLNDLYWYPGGNEQLNPEKGTSYDASLDYKLSKKDFSINAHFGAFLSYIDNWIQWKPTAYRYWIPVNISKVFARGFEVHIDAMYKHDNLKYFVSANYVFTKTTNEDPQSAFFDSEGAQLIYIPKHHANLFLNIDYKTWNFSYTFEFTGKRNTSTDKDDFFVLPNYNLHHISFGKRFGYIKTELRINNLFNMDYQAVLWHAMPKINYEFFISYKFI